MTNALITTLVILLTTLLGLGNLRRTFRPIPTFEPIRWAYAIYQAVVGAALMCLWLWLIDHPLLAVGAVSWALCVPVHLVRAANPQRHADDFEPTHPGEQLADS